MNTQISSPKQGRHNTPIIYIVIFYRTVFLSLVLALLCGLK